MSIWHWLILFAMVAIVWVVSRPWRRRGPLPSAGRSGAFDQEVSGESKYQDILARIAGPKTSRGKEYVCDAVLVREPDNQYDPNAIRVTLSGATVGYIPRGDAIALARRLDAIGGRMQCRAIIVGGWRDAQTDGSYGVKLDMG